MVESFIQSNINKNYFVSELGTIKNRKGQTIRPVLGTNGYYHVGIWKNNKQKTYSVHVFVLSSFCEMREPNLDVNHKNGNKLDNRVCNLEFVSRGENHKHAYRALKRAPVGAKKIRCIETNKSFNTITEAAKSIGIGKEGISAHLNKRPHCKTAGGYTWEFVGV